MTDPKDRTPRQTGLPEDTGNEMSDRAGYYDESGSGRGETSVGTGTFESLSVPEDTLDRDNSGTTFDAGDPVPGQ